MIEALIARHNYRMTHMRDLSVNIVREAMRTLTLVTPLDLLHRREAVRLDRAPGDYRGEWADHIAWGLDGVVTALRLLFAGQVVGAAAIARGQLERWTSNLAFNVNVERREGESTADYVDRVWAEETRRDVVPAMPTVLHMGEDDEPEGSPDDAGHGPETRVWLDEDEAAYPGQIIAGLAELLHGRGWANASRYEALHAFSDETAEVEAEQAAHLVCQALTLVMRQLRRAVASLAHEKGDHRRATHVMVSERRYFAGENPPPTPFLFPLTFETVISPGYAEPLEAALSIYEELARGRRPAGRLYRDDEMALLALFTRRGRAVRTAREAFQVERERLGDDFNLDGLAKRQTVYVQVAELAGVMSGWAGEPAVQAAAAVASSTLRSAVWLWLEDDPRSMVALRTVLEQAARLRVWRRRPDKAAMLEARQAPIRNWLDAAGWRRLNAFNRAVGELAHSHVGARWEGAHELLVALQPNATGDLAKYTGRGYALDSVTVLLAQELVETLATISPTIHKAVEQSFGNQSIVGSDAAVDLERWFNHAWSNRDLSLGETTFIGPAVDAARGRIGARSAHGAVTR